MALHIRQHGANSSYLNLHGVMVNLYKWRRVNPIENWREGRGFERF